MDKKGTKRPEENPSDKSNPDKRGSYISDEPVPEIQGKAKSGKRSVSDYNQ